MSTNSEEVLKEQRQIQKERLLASPGLIIGFTVFLIIVLSALLIPAFSSVDPNTMKVVERLKPPSATYFLEQMSLGEIYL